MPAIYKNVITQTNASLRLSSNDLFPLLFVFHLFQGHANIVIEVDVEKITFTNPYIDAIKSLWNDPGIQECYDRKREYQLSDSAK